MNRIKELRVAFALTQEQLAEKIGFNQTAVGKYERGELEPSIETLKKLSAIFECSIDYLVGHSDDFGNVTVYEQTDKISSLSKNEQYIIDCLRKNPPHNATEWVELYSQMPLYMQESIFAELKGMYLGYKAAKARKEKMEKS